MIISYKYNFIFVKTRKTAGSSIEKYLFSYLGDNDICTGSVRDNTACLNTYEKDGHIPSYKIQKKYNVEWNRFYKWAVIRNPFDCLVSFYYFHKKIIKDVTTCTFEEFIMTHNLKKFNDYNLITNKQGNITLDSIIKYENLHQTLIENKHIPYNNELLRTFVKGGIREETGYKHLYDNKMITKVEKEFHPILEKFNYSF